MFFATFYFVSAAVPSHICFNSLVGKKLFSDPLRSAESKEWWKDNIRAGSQMVLNGMKFTVLCRTSKHACVLRDLKNNEVFTTRAMSVPMQPLRPSQNGKDNALAFLLALFDSTLVEKIDIRQPYLNCGPMVFQPDRATCEFDDHPYMIIHYKNGSCLAFACTSKQWSPHITPMRLLLADEKRCPGRSMWTGNMSKAIAVDLSRMATVPQKHLNRHFHDHVYLTATRMESVLDMAMAAVMCHAHFNDDEFFDEFEGEEENEEEPPCTLIIGHYEVDPDTHLPIDSP